MTLRKIQRCRHFWMIYLLKLPVIVDKHTITDLDKEDYAMKIDQKNSGDGDDINMSGSGITAAGENNNQSRQSIHIEGNISGGNVSIGSTQAFHGNVNINYKVLSSVQPGSPLDDLKTLLQELERALKQQPTDKAEDVKLAQEYANEIAEEAAKKSPRKKKLEITGESLNKAAENLLAVSPIIAKIIQKLLFIGL